jgi:hypothetical protein
LPGKLLFGQSAAPEECMSTKKVHAQSAPANKTSTTQGLAQQYENRHSSRPLAFEAQKSLETTPAPFWCRALSTRQAIVLRCFLYRPRALS